jgi:hypothetical protein
MCSVSGECGINFRVTTERRVQIVASWTLLKCRHLLFQYSDTYGFCSQVYDDGVLCIHVWRNFCVYASGVDSASKNEYQVNPGGKGGRCLRLTTYHFHVPMSRNLGALTSWDPVGLFRPVMGQLYLLLYLCLGLYLSYVIYKISLKNCQAIYATQTLFLMQFIG